MVAKIDTKDLVPYEFRFSKNITVSIQLIEITAALAHLGERTTEVRKVACSIQASGIFCALPAEKSLAGSIVRKVELMASNKNRL